MDLRLHAAIDSLSLNPTKFSLVDNLVAIKRSPSLEPMANLVHVGPPLHCAPLVHRVVSLCVAPPR
jgi:hypothetical protein